MLWRKLRGHRFHAYKFRRQYPLGPWIADFACSKKKLIVEIDGGDHWMRKEKDRRRDMRMIKDGFLILRFNNTQIRESMDWVLEEILLGLESDRSH
jgi:very-short-patch-repair endonuclease